MIVQRSTSDILNSPVLVAEMLALMAPSYVDPRPLLERELCSNTIGYLLLNDASELQAFFLVGYGCPGRLGGELAVLLGLSACRHEDKNRGLTILLYRRFILDGLNWEAEHGERLLGWATTAHPLVWSICRHVWDVVWPREDGSYSPEAAQLAWELRRQLPRRFHEGEHPFVCRRSATNTLYSEIEALRCELARPKLPYALFDQYQINERNGDRLLMLGRLPASRTRRGV